MQHTVPFWARGGLGGAELDIVTGRGYGEKFKGPI